MAHEDDITQKIPLRRMRSLLEFAPRWLEDGTRQPDLRVVGTRYGMGLSLLCPGHAAEGQAHRLELWFLNTLDGSPPRPRTTLYYRTGSTFDELTLFAGARGRAEEPICVEGHWRGHIRGGFVIDDVH